MIKYFCGRWFKRTRCHHVQLVWTTNTRKRVAIKHPDAALPAQDKTCRNTAHRAYNLPAHLEALLALAGPHVVAQAILRERVER